MKKNKGKTISIYIAPEYMEGYERLKAISEETGRSVSEILGRRVAVAAAEENLKLRISLHALETMAEGRFEKLGLVTVDDGTKYVTA